MKLIPKLIAMGYGLVSSKTSCTRSQITTHHAMMMMCVVVCRFVCQPFCGMPRQVSRIQNEHK